LLLLYKHQWNTRWAFVRKHDILTHAKRSLLLWLHNEMWLLKQKWNGLVILIFLWSVEKYFTHSLCTFMKHFHHSKRNFVSRFSHVISWIYCIMQLCLLQIKLVSLLFLYYGSNGEETIPLHAQILTKLICLVDFYLPLTYCNFFKNQESRSSCSFNFYAHLHVTRPPP